MRTTHTLRAHNMKVAHVRGVQPEPLALVGTYELTDEDRETVTEAIVRVVRRVAPAATPAVRWRPNGLTADVSVTVAGRTTRIATFHVRPV